jgi:hypothetical protein
VERRKGGVGRHPVGAGVPGLEDRPGGRGGTGEPALASLSVGEGRLEELPHDTEGELALELAAARREHPHVVLLRGPPELRQQATLPDASRTLNQRQPPTPAGGLLKHGTKRFELGVSFQKQLGGASVAHHRDIVGTLAPRTTGTERFRRRFARSAKLAGPRSRR